MAVLTTQKVKLYRETYDFIRRFNIDPTWKISLLNAVRKSGKKNYLGTPLIGFAWIIFKSSPQFATTHGFKLVDSLRNGRFDEFANTFDDLLTKFWLRESDRQKLEQETEKYEARENGRPDFITEDDHEKLRGIESMPEEPTRLTKLEDFTQSRLEQFHAPHTAQPPQGEHLRGETEVSTGEYPGGEQKTEVPEAFKQWRDIQQPFTPSGQEEFKPPQAPPSQIPSIPSLPPTLPTPPLPPKSPVRHPELVSGSNTEIPKLVRNDNLGTGLKPRLQIKSLLTPLKSLRIPTDVSIPVKKFISRNLTPTRIASVVTGGIGSVVGYGITNTPPGAIIGGGVGLTVPSFMQSRGTGQLVLSGITKAGNAGGSFLSGISSSGAGGRFHGGGLFTSRQGFFGRATGGTGKKAAILALLGFVLLAAFLVGFTPSPGTPGGGTIATGSGTLTPIPGGSCPDQSVIDANKKDPNTCKYFGLGVNIFDTNMTQSTVDIYVNKYGGIFVNSRIGDLEQFKTRVNYIVTKSKEVGINPILGLGYWKTESNFSTVGTRDLGCSPDAINFYEQVDCKLGINDFSNPSKNPITNCARSKDAESVACKALKSIRTNNGLDVNNPIKYPISTFDDFAEAYGSRDPGLDGSGKVNNNCVSTYNKLVEVAKELNACVVSTPAPTSTLTPTLSGKIATCPLEGKRVIGCGSFMSDPKFNRNTCAGSQPIDRGHCGLSYGCYKTVGGKLVKITDPAEISNLRRAHSIDVDASVGEQVKLPFINGKASNWFSGAKFGPLSNNEGGGYGHIFTTEVDGKPWVLYFIHMNTNVIPPPSGRGYQSGDPVVTVASTPYPHLHINIAENPKSQDGGAEWLDPESLGMCTN
ncbi:hypothetical protein A3B39_04290 [Candidatus Daviesbacteria bacterium RIFCSPLOWO2_01_FULL_37_10]|nr:MAG: hypothetical protein A3B39_04290 [Candidatus Daviesbacteria bacterium RIFCSPLOWO2_01_FULL_37_10]